MPPTGTATSDVNVVNVLTPSLSSAAAAAPCSPAKSREMCQGAGGTAEDTKPISAAEGECNYRRLGCGRSEWSNAAGHVCVFCRCARDITGHGTI